MEDGITFNDVAVGKDLSVIEYCLSDMAYKITIEKHLITYRAEVFFKQEHHGDIGVPKRFVCSNPDVIGLFDDVMNRLSRIKKERDRCIYINKKISNNQLFKTLYKYTDGLSESIVNLASEFFGVDLVTIKNRSDYTIKMRSMIYRYLNDTYGVDHARIAAIFKKDRTTILHAINCTFVNLYDTDPTFKSTYNSLEKYLNDNIWEEQTDL